jgi:protein KRI1
LARKREEVKRLKGLKMKDLRAKLERIGREGGKNLDETTGGIWIDIDMALFLMRFTYSFAIALQDLDLEGDWDPESYDQQMASLYGNDGIDADEKPQWDDDIDIGDIISDDEATSNEKRKTKKKKKKKGKKSDEEDEGVDVDAMDADVERIDGEEWDGTEEMRKRKLDEYMDEIYGLDFNDMVNRLSTLSPCIGIDVILCRLEKCLPDLNIPPCNLSHSP